MVPNGQEAGWPVADCTVLDKTSLVLASYQTKVSQSSSP